MHNVNESENSMLWRYQLSQNWSIESTQSQSKSHQALTADSKYMEIQILEEKIGGFVLL